MRTRGSRIILLMLILLTAASMVGGFLLRRSTRGSYLWVMDAGKQLDQYYLVKMCSTGRKLASIQFGQGGAIGIDPRDGAVWATELNTAQDIYTNKLVKLSADWLFLYRIPGYRSSVIAVDPNDGNVWVGLPNEGILAKFSANGVLLFEVDGFPAPASLAIDPRDGSLWAADYHPPAQLVHLSADGEELNRTETPGFFSNAPHQVAVDASNGHVWYTASDGSVIQRSADGEWISTTIGLDRPTAIAVDPRSGSAWAANFSVAQAGSVVNIGTDGTILNNIPLEYIPRLIAFDPADATVWVGINGAMLKLSGSGEIITLVDGFTSPYSITLLTPKGLPARIRYAFDCYR